MNTRCLLLPAILIGALVSGCAVSSDAPDGAAPEPQPKAEKSKAELLVGTWKHVKRTPPRAKGNESTFEYTKDGRVMLRKFNPLDGEEIHTGTYRIEGDTLFRTMDTEPVERNATIQLLTADKLITASSLNGERYVNEYERVREK